MNLRLLTTGLTAALLALVALAAACGDDDGDGDDIGENAGRAVIGDMTYDFDVALCSVVDEDTFNIEGIGTTEDDEPVFVDISRSRGRQIIVHVGINQTSFSGTPDRRFSAGLSGAGAVIEIDSGEVSMQLTGTLIEVPVEGLPEFPSEIDLRCLV